MNPASPRAAARRLAAELELRRRTGSMVAVGGRAARRLGVPTHVLVRAGSRLRRVLPWDLGSAAALIRASHDVFDNTWYLDHNPDVAAAGMDPVRHYLLYGAAQRRSPHPLFDTGWYLDENPDVAAAGINPLVHYLTLGAAERRTPHLLFDTGWYLDENPDVAAAGINPLVHYLRTGSAEGRSPHPLFQTGWYVSTYPDVRSSGFDPLVHYLLFGGFLGLLPNPWFDSASYLAENPDVLVAGQNPLMHYICSGAAEGRRPGPRFDPAWYLRSHPDVTARGEEPLRHFCAVGQRAGYAPNRLDERAGEWGYQPGRGEVPWVNPVAFVVRARLAGDPKLNVLIPSLGLRHMSGGPNTALQFVARLAADGERVRLISTDQGIDEGSDEDALWRHIGRLTGLPRRHRNLEIVDGSDPQSPVSIGEHDVFFATAFWTAQAVKSALPLVRPQRFLYLVQDFEPGFFAASSQYALALETYALDHFPIVNTQILFDYLVANRVGRFGDPAFLDDAVVFQPSVDRFHFYVDAQPPRPHRLLFYARPTAGLRNMFELGVAALRLAEQRGVFAGDWTFAGMGDRFLTTALGGEALLRAAPWLDFDGYAQQMRQSDVLLSLMLAPHPSYPPLEMAACGGLVVTNSYDVKTADRLESISRNIVTAEPTVEGIAAALAEAVERLADVEGRRRASALSLPEDWDDAVLPLIPRIRQAIKEIRHGASRLDRALRTEAEGPYDAYRLARIRQRADEYRSEQVPGLLSLMTPVWNTDPDFLRLLAESVLSQEGGTSFEWVVLDNGSDDPGTLSELARIAAHPCVRSIRSETNLGIIAGMRRCLEAATGRYVAHLDHDDLLAPDAIRTVTTALLAGGEPALFYSDEDKLLSDVFVEPYFKPDWDPVLLSNSSYVAHFCGVRRDVALALGAYDDESTATSPDWDLFVRALLAGHEPLHVAEVLYSWRMHPGSTAGDISTKPTVGASHHAVLSKLVAGKGVVDRFEIVSNPRSPGGLDGWIRRRRDVPARDVTTVVLGRDVPIDGPVSSLRPYAEAAMADGALLRLQWAAATPVDDEWRWEAPGLMELFPDTAVVGGPVEQNGRLVAADDVLGFGRGCESPNVGRGPDEYGWMVSLSKQRSVSAVSAQHLVADAAFVADALDAMPAAATLANLGAWLGAHAARRGRRVVYSPHIRARVTDDLGTRVSPEDWWHFNRANADVMPDVRFLSRSVRLDVRGDLVPATSEERADHLRNLLAEPPAALPAYREWLDARIRSRAPRFPRPAAPASLAVVTPVYEGTDVTFFDELVESLTVQSVAFSEWIIATDGPLTPVLESRLRELMKADERIRVLLGPRRGILATMRACLEAATADYVTPIDADDLLTPDAFAVLVAAIESGDRPALVYSDEDIIDSSGPRDPFLRPDWDPVLQQAGSYIWHLISFRRDVALDVGVYTDTGANWCHDWDTVDLITAAGYIPVHVAEVLYHWRHHDRSSTNTADPNAGSQQSVRHVMERMIARAPHPERYTVEPFPIDRGATEWYITRRPVDPPPIGMVVVTDGAEPVDSFVRSVARTSTVDFGDVRALPLGPGGWAGAVADGLRRFDTTFAVVASDAVDLVREGWLWEAVKLLELHPDVAVVSGRIVEPVGRIVAGGEVPDPATGLLVAPLHGRPLADPGPYAFALKPHEVSALTPRLFVADRAAVLAALDAGATDGPTLAAALARAGRRLAYTPLLEARISAADPPAVGTGQAGAVMGLAGFDWGRRQFSP